MSAAFPRTDVTDRARAVAAVPSWFHTIDLGDGLVTKGVKTADQLGSEWDEVDAVGIAGRTVLDIGAWDGYFSFRAEDAGASRVVAFDHYVWSIDQEAFDKYWQECRRLDVAPAPYDEVPGVWDPVGLPGKRGFDTATAVRSSRVESHVGDFMTDDLAALGTFDVVLFLGVLYHLRDPFLALRRLREVTAGVAVVETAAITVPGHDHRPLWEFYPTDELDGDASNFWAPNGKGLADACIAAGFGRVQMVRYPVSAPDAAEIEPGRIALYAYAEGPGELVSIGRPKARVDSRKRRGLSGSLEVTATRSQDGGVAGRLRATNTGSALWLPGHEPEGPVRVAVRAFDGDGAELELSSNRILFRPAEQDGTAAGQAIESAFELDLAPHGWDAAMVEFDLVAESVCYFSQIGMPVVRVALGSR